MIPSFSSWKVVIFFGKEHINWSSISGDMMRRSWKIKFGKLNIGVSKKIKDLIVQLLPIITPLILDQFSCSLPKNVTTFHKQQDGIIHFYLSPKERGVLALWINIFTKKINDLFQTQLLNIIQIAKTPILLGLRQKLMIPSCCPWKVVTFFGKDHVNWSSINGVMIGRKSSLENSKLV